MPLPAGLETRLRTIHGYSFVAIRRQVQQVLGDCLDSDGVVFDRRVVVDGRMWMRDMLHHGASTAVLRMHAEMVRRPDPVVGPGTMRGLPMRRRDGAGFLELAAITRRADFEQSQLFNRYFHPLGIVDQLRMFAFHASRLIGWIGYFRTTGSRAFTESDRRRLQPLVEPIVAALVAADRLQADAQTPADLVVRADGSVAHASASAQGWLADDAFHRALIERVRNEDRGTPVDPDSGPLGSAHARLVRLDGPDGVRYLVNVTPATPQVLGAGFALSERELAVAEAAAAGATIAEIARDLDLGTETVRTHLKAVYRKLEVASRVDLAAALRG